jgi:hypothetical protein
MSQSNKYDPTISHFDPSRPNVGKIYRDLQMQSDGTAHSVGDMSNEQMKGFVEDVNENLMKDPYNGKPFYLAIVEKKDLQMKSAIARIPYIFSYRPWPEDNTTVFWKDPRSQELRFCWTLPHWSEMDNMLANPHFYAKEMIDQIAAWKKYDLSIFGFYWHPDLEWVPNPKHKDRRIESAPTISYTSGFSLA